LLYNPVDLIRHQSSLFVIQICEVFWSKVDGGEMGTEDSVHILDVMEFICPRLLVWDGHWRLCTWLNVREIFSPPLSWHDWPQACRLRWGIFAKIHLKVLIALEKSEQNSVSTFVHNNTNHYLLDRNNNKWMLHNHIRYLDRFFQNRFGTPKLRSNVAFGCTINENGQWKSSSYHHFCLFLSKRLWRDTVSPGNWCFDFRSALIWLVWVLIMHVHGWRWMRGIICHVSGPRKVTHALSRKNIHVLKVVGHKRFCCKYGVNLWAYTIVLPLRNWSLISSRCSPLHGYAMIGVL
jgi:hypothetical protein